MNPAFILGYLVIAAASVYFQSWAAVTFWLLPMVLTKPVHQMQNTIEHLGLTHESDILNNTRSTRTNALMRWLCWQMPYHTAHPQLSVGALLAASQAERQDRERRR